MVDFFWKKSDNRMRRSESMNRRKMGTGVMAAVLAVSMMVTPAMAGEQGQQDSADVIDHAAHDNRETYEILKNATCTEVGEIEYTCSVDQVKYTEELPLTEHEWEYRTDKEATYETPGVKSLYCKVCDAHKEDSEEEIPALKYVESIQLDQTEATLKVGDALTLKAEIAPEDAADKDLIWESSDKEVAVVDQHGVVTAVKPGEAEISVRSADGNAVATCKITVLKKTYGLNGVCQDPDHPTDWYYYVDGEVDTNYNGITNNENGWWKIKDGKVDFDYTGIAPNEQGWWRVENGRVNFDYNGITYNENGWWKIKDGAVDFAYTGISNNENGWWRIENGKVNFDYNGITYNENGWWKIENGMVNFNYWGIAPNEYGWWKIEGGRVNFDYTGVAQNENGWWRVENGMVNFYFNGIAENENGWWYLEGGRVNFNYTGNGWFGNSYCQIINGKVQLQTKYVYVSDASSIMYGKTLKLFYDGYGNVIEDVSGLIGGNHTYELYVNKTKNMVTVYTTEGNVYIPVKRFICSQGGSNTPEGIFYTPAKYRWQELMGPCWGQWCTRINGRVLFHSVFYKQYQNNQTLSVNAYNKLGTTCSHGCVRLTAGDAKWIYDNCALSTKVVIYSKGGYEPFSKPTAYKLPSWHTWDPTDPNMYWKCQQNGCH